MSAKLKIDDSQFRSILATYMGASKKTLAQGLNTKSYFIVKKAIRLTRVANKKEIRRFVRSPEGQNWIGSLFGRKKLTDETRKAATKRIISARIKSVAYLRSGWIPALKAFGRVTKMPRRTKGVVHRGKPKGYGRWARDGFSPAAIFTNSTGYKPKQASALKQYGEPALSRAFSHEARSMKSYLERKMQQTANRTRMGR